MFPGIANCPLAGREEQNHSVENLSAALLLSTENQDMK